MRNGWGAVLALVVAWGAAAAGPLVLADKGETRYRIVIPAQAIPSERYAAEELRDYVTKISGATLPIVTDAEARGTHEILLGQTNRLRPLKVKIDFATLGAESFTLRTAGNHLVIAGGRPRGTLYGVYQVLEDRLGVRWFAPDAEVVPRTSRVLLPALNETHHPSFEYRDVMWVSAMRNPDFSARLRLNGRSHNLREKHGGPAVVYYPFVHTLDALIPRALFAEHPDYFPMINGVRVGEGHVERCISHPEVLALSIARVRQWIADNPAATIISVSQNDSEVWCHCPPCTALSEEEGSYAAVFLRFVNAIAADIEKDYPHIRIDTLAYKFTRKAPATIRPRKNVVVRLCSIECCFAHPLESCPSEANRRFREDNAAWQRITPNLYMWDYTTNYRNYLQPFPNFDVLQPNLQFFKNHGVIGVLEQGNYQGAGEMEPLRVYLLAKLLWDVDADVHRRHQPEFLRGYYGTAAGAVRAYLDAFHAPVREWGYHLRENDYSNVPYLTDAAIARADAALAAAEERAENAVIRRRVQAARLPVWFTQLVTGRVTGAERAALLTRFVEVARAANVTYISERERLDAWAKRMAEE